MARYSRSNLSRLANVHLRKRWTPIGQSYIIGRIALSLVYFLEKCAAEAGVRMMGCAEPVIGPAQAGRTRWLNASLRAERIDANAAMKK